MTLNLEIQGRDFITRSGKRLIQRWCYEIIKVKWQEKKITDKRDRKKGEKQTN